MAASKDIRSKFSLQFEAPGAEQTKKKVDRIRESLGKLGDGSKAVNASAISAVTHRNLKQMSALQKQVGQLSGSFKALNQAVQKLISTINNGGGGSGGGSGRGGPGGGPGGGGGSGGGPGPGGGRRPMTPKDTGSFFRGLLQGSGMGEFYPGQNKMGMAKQAAGRAVGRIGAGMASMPFSGIAGAQQALAGIPIVGGMAAGTLGQGAAVAQQNLAYQKNILGMSPFLNGRNMAAASGAAAQARSSVMSRGIDEERVKTAGRRAYPINTSAGADGGDAAVALAATEMSGGGKFAKAKMMAKGEKAVLRPTEAAIAAVRKDAETRERTRLTDLLEKEADTAAAKAGRDAGGRDPLARLNRAGVSLGGMNAMESTDFAKALLSRSGGSLDQAHKGSFMRNAISAQTVFGASAETTGAFGKAARRGGIIGAEGSAGGALAKAIKSGMEAGMDNTEVREFLEITARAQEQFMKTGIPVNTDSMAKAMGAVTGAGLGVGRGMHVGQAMTDRIQSISQKGPQSSADFLMLQKFGGFKGGGLEDLENAMGKMENMKDMKPEQFLDFISSISKGSGGGTAGRFSLREVFGKMGASLGVNESKMLQEVADTGGATGDNGKKVEAIKQQLAERYREAQGFNLQKEAGAQVGGIAPGVKTQAGIDNLNIAIGGKLLPTIHNFELSTQQSVLALSKFAPTMTAISDSTLKMSEKLPGIAAEVQDIFAWIAAFMKKTGGPGSGL